VIKFSGAVYDRNVFYANCDWSFVVFDVVVIVRLIFNCGFGGDLIAVELPSRFDLPRQLNDGFCGVEYGISPNIFLAISRI